ncbi:MAG: AAC(3) family N-acetyltransferase [Butyrivibrio sp.]|nr:AAC(3) family N-acetyltransferase [Butyrivibrio sp.]
MSDKYISINNIAREFEIKKGDIINLSSDILALAYIAKNKEGTFDANNILDSFIDCIGSEGTLLVPTFNFDFSNKGFYDYKNTKCTTGALGNIALERSDFKRTWNPMHSYAIWGKYKDELCSIQNLNSFGQDSPFAWMYKNNAIQILLGTDYQRGMTFVHYVETKEKVPYRFHKEFTGTYVKADGTSSTITIEYPAKYLEYGSVEKFNRIGQILEKNGVSHQYVINGIQCYKMNLADCYPFIQNDILYNQCRNLFDFKIEREKIWSDHCG